MEPTPPPQPPEEHAESVTESTAPHSREDFYSTSETSKLLGITESRVRQLARAASIEGVRAEEGWKLYRYSVHAFRDQRRTEEEPVEARESSVGAREWIDRVTTLERELGRLEGRLELTEVAESTVREALEREREENQRLREELEAERSKGFWRRLFGG